MAREVQAESDETAGPSRPGRPIEPMRLLSMLVAGRWWLLGAAVIGLSIGVLTAKFYLKQTFETTSAMRYGGLEPLDPAMTPDIHRDMPPLLDAFVRDAFLARVRDQMFATTVPLIVVRSRYNIVVDNEAGVVGVTGSGDSPEDAALFVNTVVETFIAYQRDRRAEAIQEAITALDGRVAASSDELSRSQSAYDAFRQANGVSAELSTDQTSAMAAAADLRARAALAQAALSGLEARVARLRETGPAPAPTPQDPTTATGPSTSSPEAQAARAALAEARQQLNAVQGRLSEDHPRYQALRHHVEDLEARVATFTSSGGGPSRAQQTSLREAEAQLDENRREQAELQQFSDEAQARVNAFSEIEGEAAELLADVTVKTGLLTDLRNRRARLASMLTNVDPGFRVMARAVEPEGAVDGTRGRKYKVALGVPFAFIFVTILFLTLREFRKLRLLSSREVAFWANAPVIGATTWPRNTKALSDLVADLDDYVPDARGTMLVVGITDKEVALAVELAKQMGSDWSLDSSFDLMSNLRHSGDDSMGNMRRSLMPSNPASNPDFENNPTTSNSEMLAPPTIVQSGAPYGLFTAAANPAQRLVTTAWEGDVDAPGLRRQARLADRVLVVVPSGAVTLTELRTLKARLGRADGVGYVLVGLTKDLASYPDRCGPVEEFWAATRLPTNEV